MGWQVGGRAVALTQHPVGSPLYHIPINPSGGPCMGLPPHPTSGSITPHDPHLSPMSLCSPWGLAGQGHPWQG